MLSRPSGDSQQRCAVMTLFPRSFKGDEIIFFWSFVVEHPSVRRAIEWFPIRQHGCIAPICWVWLTFVVVADRVSVGMTSSP